MSLPATFPPMRPQIELQRVHDMLMTVLGNHGLTVALVPESQLRPLMLATDCLCWALHHDVDSHPSAHASHFARIIQDLRHDLEEVGYMDDRPESEYIIEE